jgi:hypothetical protein
MQRIELIKKIALQVQSKSVQFALVDRQALQLADREYVTVKKTVAETNELNFN